MRQWHSWFGWEITRRGRKSKEMVKVTSQESGEKTAQALLKVSCVPDAVIYQGEQDSFSLSFTRGRGMLHVLCRFQTSIQ